MKDVLVRKGAAGFILFVLVGVAAIPLMSTIDRGSPLGFEQGGTTEQLTYTFSFVPPTVGTIETAYGSFTKIALPGCLVMGEQPGNPMLPVKFIQLLLPPQETVDAVTVTGSSVELRSSGRDLTREHVFPSQKEVPAGSAAPSWFVMNEEVYSSHDLYPTVPYGSYHIGFSHGYAILDIALQPVQLIPAEGRLFYYPEMTVTVNLQKTGYVNPFFRGTPEDEAWVKSLVSNPDVAVRYSGLQRSGYPGGLCDPSDHYDYVIITTTQNFLDHWNVSDDTPYNWDSLMEKHMYDGLLSKLVTIQDINACPDYWNTTYYPLFNDTQAHIREFCKDAYEDWGTNYVLIAGDSDTIAARQLYYEYEGNVDSDLYWSNLDNTFNADHDNQWGEEGDSGFDPYSELFIGRVPCDVPQDVSNWLTKSFYYADSTDPDYLENGGFFASNTGWPPGGDGGDTMIDFAAINGTDHWYGSDPGQWPGFLGFLYGFATWNTVHPDNAFNLSVRWTAGYPPNPGWNWAEDAAAAFRNVINNDSVTLITGVGHADGQMSLDVYEYDWQTLYHNTKPFFIIDLGCHCGDFDASNDGVLDTMLFDSNQTLAFGCLFATGYSWGGFQGTNSSDCLQTKLFWDYFFDLANNSQSTDNWQLGKGVAWSKDIMAPTLNWTYSGAPGSWRGTIEDRLLFADPAQLLKPPRDQNNPPYISFLRWYPNVGLEVSATDPDGFFEKVFIQIDWGDGTITDWLGPYHSDELVTLTHTWAMPGDYIVKARAKDVHDAVSGWSAIVVHIPDTSLAISIRGGLGITVKINNTGSDNATNVKCAIGLSGFILMGKSMTRDMDIILPGKTITIRAFILGFGRTTVDVNATSAEGAIAEKTAKGYVLGVFVFGLQ
jgi:hypothetical protein